MYSTGFHHCQTLFPRSTHNLKWFFSLFGNLGGYKEQSIVQRIGSLLPIIHGIDDLLASNRIKRDHTHIIANIGDAEGFEF